MGRLVVGPAEALKLIQIRYRDYVEAKARWEACVARHTPSMGPYPGSGNYPEWAESEAKLNRLLELLKDITMPPPGAAGIAPAASKETKGDL